MKNSLKEVKFGGVVEEEPNMFMKKRDKVRSPSILKNSSRNILNGSILSAQKERSCSVASGKGRRTAGKEKAGEHSINNVMKQKYKAIINKLQAESQTGGQGRGNRFSGAVYNSQKAVIKSPYKYKDEIFPPVYSSLFCLKKNRPKIGQQIRWMRLSDLYKQKQIVLAQPNSTSIQITKSDQSYCEDYFPGALNCLLGCPKLLQKMFQNQAINPYGVYIVKIYQQCQWKYIIIDDYIPVIKTKQGFQPAFTNVKVINDHPMDIWPFLLQKAYANYYSSYEALQYGNMVDLAEELTGNPSETIQLKIQSPRKKDKMSPQQIQTNLKKFLKYVKAGNTLIIGEFCGDKGYAPIIYDLFSAQLYWNDPFCQFKKRKLSTQGLKQTFKTVHIIFPFKSSHCSTTILRKTRPSILKKQQLNGLYQPQLPSIRTFKIDQTGEYSLSIRQRDKRFFHFKQKHGEYIWCRAILLQKEYQDCGYRWIDGCYSQKKSINFTNTLQPGEYWLVLEPQWRNNSANELMIHIYSRYQLQFRRQVYKEEQRILQKGCLDLAQRYGELNQINKFICSYNYITEKVGLIIQNIVNERVTGNVSVMRSIRGLTCKSEILPVNMEFYEKVATERGEMLKLSEEIELDIPNGEHFTVVLKLKGGIDTKFFRTFDFGC